MNNRNNRIKPFLVIGLFTAVMTAGGCAATRTSKSTGEYIDDATISTKVKTELLANEHVKGTHIEVETYKGTVQLSGFADSASEAETAVSVARSVPGVRSVKNDIVVNR